MPFEQHHALAQFDGTPRRRYYTGGNPERAKSIEDLRARCGAEALILTTNSQVHGQRFWDDRTRMSQTMPSIPSIFDAVRHPR